MIAPAAHRANDGRRRRNAPTGVRLSYEVVTPYPGGTRRAADGPERTPERRGSLLPPGPDPRRVTRQPQGLHDVRVGRRHARSRGLPGSRRLPELLGHLVSPVSVRDAGDGAAPS